MAKPRRPLKSAPRKKKRRRLGTILFLVGVLAVLGATFAAGALAGRLSLKPTSPLAAPAKSVERVARATPLPAPILTFYRELTAPLVPPPLPPKAARAAAKAHPVPAAASPSTEPAVHDAAASSDGAITRDPASESARRAEATAAAGPAPGADGARYTVQVGSYNVRAQAEALRGRLADGGHDAYIVEGEAGGTTRYRVRVGSFASKDDARQAATRLAGQAQVATYVTTR